MGTLSNRLNITLKTYEDDKSLFSEADLYQELDSLTSENIEGDETEKINLMAETMAFGFVEDYQNDSNNWGTYFGPYYLNEKDGQWSEVPSVRLITPEIIKYWEGRAEQVKNPQFCYRYSDLVWDFSQTIICENPNIKNAYNVLDSILRILSENRTEFNYNVVKKLRRGVSVALSISDKNRLEKIIIEIIKYEDLFCDDHEILSWGFSFDILMGNKKIPLTTDQKEKIITDLESRFQRLIQYDDKLLSIFASKNVVSRLVEYYRKNNRNEDIKELILKYGNKLIYSIDEFNLLEGLSLIYNLQDIYYKNNMKDEAEHLSSLVNELSKKMGNELHPIYSNYSMSDDDMEKLCNQILVDDIDESIANLVLYFLPIQEQIKKQIRELAKNYPTLFLLSETKIDREGRIIATVGSIMDDFDGRVINQIDINMMVTSLILNEVLNRFYKKFNLTLEKLVDYFYLTPLYPTLDRKIITIGLDEYFKGNHLSSAHILVTQIENLIRNQLQLLGGGIYKLGRNGGMFLKSLDEILREEKLINVLGDDISLYLRILFTDQRGWNIRNNVCHGIYNFGFYNSTITDRLIHVLLLFSLCKVE